MKGKAWGVNEDGKVKLYKASRIFSIPAPVVNECLGRTTQKAVKGI